MITGSTPTVVWSTIRARGLRPNSSAFSRVISSTAAAPSEIWLELPAVTLPSSLNAGLSSESVSRLVSGRMPWSVTTVSSVPFILTFIGIVSRSKRPSSVAWCASWCERSPSSSSSERGISHLSAIISAEMPCGTRL